MNNDDPFYEILNCNCCGNICSDTLKARIVRALELLGPPRDPPAAVNAETVRVALTQGRLCHTCGELQEGILPHWHGSEG
ncbi:MAG: hypothetical protein ACYSVY_21780 [Planctomycetota bacterium]|jgi:hypothetical protein